MYDVVNALLGNKYFVRMFTIVLYFFNWDKIPTQ